MLKGSSIPLATKLESARQLRVVFERRTRRPEDWSLALCLIVWWREGTGLLVAHIAHSHSASQFLRHLPQHWNSIMLPPHWGQMRLMIDEIMLALGSPGMVSIVIIPLLLRDPSSSSEMSCPMLTR